MADSLKKELSKHADGDSLRVNLLNNLAFEQYFDHPSEAASYALEAGSISDQINYAAGKARSYRMLGLTFWAQANLSAALTYFVTSLKLADSLDDKQLQADITGNMGLVYNGMDNYPVALNYFKQSVTRQRQLKNVIREAAMLNNVGDCYFRMKKFDSALFNYRQALELGKPKKFGIATNTRNIGNVYEAMGEFDQALNYYYKAKIISDSLSDHRGMTLVRKSIASVLFQRKQYASAETLASECLDIASKSRLKAIVRDSYELLSRIASAQGRADQSLGYFKLFTLYKDSIQNLSESAKISSLQLEYETHRKQTEINSLVKESRWKNTLLISAIAGIMIVLFLLFTSIRSYTRVKQRNKEILALNFEIRKHRQDVIRQRDALAEKNMKIESLHETLSDINKSLEQTVLQRTEALKDQNKHLEEYAFITAHKLRAPLARVLGLINLLEKNIPIEEQRLLLEHLKNASNELDGVIRSVSNTLHEGMQAFDNQNSGTENPSHRSSTS